MSEDSTRVGYRMFEAVLLDKLSSARLLTKLLYHLKAAVA